MNKQQEKYGFGYTRCGRDNGYLKEIEKLKENKNQYEDVIIVNKTTADDEQTKERKCENLREYRKQYYEENRGRILEQKRPYNEANEDKIQERGQQYREANNDEIRERGRQYREANEDKIRERARQYRETNKDLLNERAMEKMERLRMGVAESNVTKNACRRCLKLMDINNFISCKGKIYNTCKVCSPKINHKIWWDNEDEIKSEA